MEQMIIAERLISLRKEASLSQAKVAELLSVSRQAVSKWESGKASPSLTYYSALATLYDTTPDLVLSGKEFDKENDSPALLGESFAERLREGRTLRQISQGELADALSVSRQSVSKWESGKSEPDADRLVALSDFLNLPLAMLIPSFTAPSVSEEKPVIANEGVDTAKAEKTSDEKATEEVQKEPDEKVMENSPQIQLEPDTTFTTRRERLEERVRRAGQKHKAIKAARAPYEKERQKPDALPLIAAIPFCVGALSLFTSKKKKQ